MTDILTRLITDEIIKIAKKMIAKNEPIEKIAEFTDLDIDTIKELQERENRENDNK